MPCSSKSAVQLGLCDDCEILILNCPSNGLCAEVLSYLTSLNNDGVKNSGKCATLFSPFILMIFEAVEKCFLVSHNAETLKNDLWFINNMSYLCA
jgi:hypothetical protein